MAGMRDVLIHAYDQIDLEEVWMAYQLFPKIRSQVADILEQNLGGWHRRCFPARARCTCCQYNGTGLSLRPVDPCL